MKGICMEIKLFEEEIDDLVHLLLQNKCLGK